MVARAIVSAFTAFSLSAYAYGAEIHDRSDVEWPTGNRIAPGWDITIDGEIVPGDDVTFRATLNRVKTTNPNAWPVIVWLNSPGGNVLTSERIADLINHFHLWTHVDELCASSCFMLFMAGIDRKFAPKAEIGVHSASNEQGNETPASLAVTMMIIRKAQAYGVDSATVIPPSIIGKLAGTLGTDISWLSREELQQIGASMDPPEAIAVTHTPKVILEANAFAEQYAREQPGYTASSGGQDGVLRRWLDSYDDAYSAGTPALDCGMGSMPDNDGCRAAARDYRATHRGP